MKPRFPFFSRERARSAHAALVALALFAALQGAAPAHAAPDEEAYGKSSGYPVGATRNWTSQGYLVGSLSAAETIFPTRDVKALGPARELPRAAKEPDWPEIDAYLARHPASGLMILKDGHVLVERYQYARGPQHRFTSFSMAKTVIAMAIGIAVAQGRIASIDDPVERYEPALEDSAWKGVTIRQALTMSSGVAFDETYDTAESDIALLSRTWALGLGRMLSVLRLYKVREAAPGQRFKYISADTQVLTQVLARATARPVADYVGEMIWTPMGAQTDGKWIIEPGGGEAGYCCLSAPLSDWARLGQMLLDEGRVGERQVIPADWVRQATTLRAEDRHLQPGVATPYFGYGFQTWIFPENLGFALLGVRGQAVYVNPRLRVVMVQTAVWPRSSNTELARERDRFWRAVLRRVGTPG